MTVTTAELRAAIADELRISGVDQELDAERAAKIDARIDSFTAEYRETGAIWWADNAIPNACKDAMMMIGAARCCRLFGKGGQGYETGERAGLDKLAELKASAIVDQTVPDFF